MTKRKAHKMKVTTHALIQRINRRLKPDLEKLRTTRGERMQLDVGQYYVIDYRINGVVRKDVDPEALGRELDVLKAYEEVVD